MKQNISASQLRVLKNEVHNLYTVLRLTQQSQKRFKRDEPYLQNATLQKFESLLPVHTASTDTVITQVTQLIQDSGIPGPVTTALLSAIQKFVTHNLVPEDPRAISALVTALVHCVFRPTHTEADEVVHLRILCIITEILRNPNIANRVDESDLLNMMRKCFQIGKEEKATLLLRSTSENTLQHIVHKIFCMDDHTDMMKAKTLRFIAFLISYGTRTDNHHKPLYMARGISSDDNNVLSQLGGLVYFKDIDNNIKSLEASESRGGVEHHDISFYLEMRSLGLQLLGVALEADSCVGESKTNVDLVKPIIQTNISKGLLLNTQTDNLYVLAMTLRSFLNLIKIYKLNLKGNIQLLPTWLTIEEPTLEGVVGKSKKAITKQAQALIQQHLAKNELIMNFYSELCDDFELILEIFMNYDCDIRCVNVLEHIVKAFKTAMSVSKKLQDDTGSKMLIRKEVLTTKVPTKTKIILASSRTRKISGRVSTVNEIAFKGLHKLLRSLLVATERLTPIENDAQHTSLVSTTKFFEKQNVSQQIERFNKTGNIAKDSFDDETKVAIFLRQTPQLDLGLVGEFLAKQGDVNHRIRTTFMEQIDFKGLSIVQSLRLLLSAFRLPREAQQIERIVETFAEVYFCQQPVVKDAECLVNERNSNLAEEARRPRWIAGESPKVAFHAKLSPRNVLSINDQDFFDEPRKFGFALHSSAPLQNMNSGVSVASISGIPPPPLPPGPPPHPSVSEWQNYREATPPVQNCVIFHTSDTVFVLSYSIILLNTDLHNPQVKKKMSLEDFVKNNSGINNHQNFPLSYLESLYNVIKDEEISILACSEGSSRAMRVFERKECVDYVLCNPELAGDYKQLVGGNVSPEILKQVFGLIWANGRLLFQISRLLLATKNYRFAVSCVEALSEIGQLAISYEQYEVFKQILRVLMFMLQPTFSFKSQLIVPALCQLFTVGTNFLGFNGWYMYFEFISRLTVMSLIDASEGYCGNATSQFSSFPVSSKVRIEEQNNSAKNNYFLSVPPTFRMYEALSESPVTSTGWLSELTALLFPLTGATLSGGGSVSQGVIVHDNANEIETSENTESIGEERRESLTWGETIDESYHGLISSCLRWWATTKLFPKAKIDMSEDDLTTISTSESLVKAYKFLMKSRYDLSTWTLREEKEVECDPQYYADIAKALLMKCLPLGDIGTEVDEKEHRVIYQLQKELDFSGDQQRMNSLQQETIQCMKHDWIPLLRFSSSEDFLKFESLHSTVSALEALLQIILNLNDKAEESIVFSVYAPLVIVLEGLFVRHSKESLRVLDPDLVELSMSQILEVNKNIQRESSDSIPTVESLKVEDELIQIALFANKNITFKHLNSNEFAFLVERLVLISLRLCVSLGHVKNTKITASLARLYDLVCRLENNHFQRQSFQIASASSLLLCHSVYLEGLHCVPTSQLFGNKKNIETLPVFFLSFLDFLQRLSPYFLAVAQPSQAVQLTGVHNSGTVEPHRDFSLQAMTQTGFDQLSALASSTVFHQKLCELLLRPTYNVKTSLSVAHFTRYLTQTFLAYALPFHPSDFSSTKFDVEDGTSQGNLCEIPKQTQYLNDEADAIPAMLFDMYTGVVNCVQLDQKTEGQAEALWQLWGPVAQALAIITSFGTRSQRRQAMMKLQQHLSVMPCLEPPRYWIEVIELILFPLISQSFIYPFPTYIPPELLKCSNEIQEAQLTDSEAAIPNNLGQSLLNLFLDYKLVLCQLPNADLILNLIDPIRSFLRFLPAEVLMQRKAQSVSFVCRAVLGKLDILFEPIALIPKEDKLVDERTITCLIPTVIRILRVFLYEMHASTTGMFDAFVEASKNFLLVLATSVQLERLQPKERDWALELLTAQDPRTLVPEPTFKNDNLLTTEKEVLMRYKTAFGEILQHLTEGQNLLFSVVYLMLSLADRDSIMQTVFEVLVSNNASWLSKKNFLTEDNEGREGNLPESNS